jgi:HNH endonuclease
MTPPFVYPPTAHVRRHGPKGYANYPSYRPWLRDEFTFRCVYCLLRERWILGGLHIDHFSPVARSPELATDYDNLLYCCSSCNAAKRDLKLPDATKALLEESMKVLEDGTIEASAPAAARIIKLLGLNTPKYREYRVMWIEIVALARRYQPVLYKQLLSFPDDLPDLSTLLPPDGNTRPEGVATSYFAQQKNSTLPETY